MEQKLNIDQSEKKPKTKKIITAVIFFIIIVAIIYLVGTEANRWWQVRKEYIRMGLASDKFPFRMFTEEELVEKGLWPVESEYYNSIPTRTTPEETYAIFRQALIDGDLDKAVECFVEGQKEEWRESLNEIKEKGFLQDMLNDLPAKLEDTYIYTDDVTGGDTKDRDLDHTAMSSYVYIIKSDPEKIAQTMTFIKDLHGDWKIEDL